MITIKNKQEPNPELDTIIQESIYINQDSIYQASSSSAIVNQLKPQDIIFFKSLGDIEIQRNKLPLESSQGIEMPQIIHNYSINSERQRKQRNKKRLQKIRKRLREKRYKNRSHQQCPVCFAEFQRELLRQFSTCQHKFCNTCLEQHIKNSLKNFKPIRCLTEDCPVVLDIQSPHIKSLTRIQQQRYYKAMVFSNLSNNSELKLCTTKNCQGFVCLNQEIVKCALCQVVFCRKCLMPVHRGECDQNGVLFLQEQFKFRRCEQCRMLLEKNQGCNHMTCRCGYQFCYICGGKWAANHRCYQPARNEPQRIAPPERSLPPPVVLQQNPPHTRQQQAISRQANANVSALSSNIANARAQILQQNVAVLYLKRGLKILLAIFLILFIAIIDIMWGVSIVATVTILFIIHFMYVSAKNGLNVFKDNYSCLQIIVGNIFLLLFCIGRQIWNQFGRQLRQNCTAAYRSTEFWLFPFSKKVWYKIIQ